MRIPFKGYAKEVLSFPMFLWVSKGKKMFYIVVFSLLLEINQLATDQRFLSSVIKKTQLCDVFILKRVNVIMRQQIVD